MAVETLGEALSCSWRVNAKCSAGRIDAMKRGRECVYRAELSMETLVWTRGRAFPLSELATRLRCPMVRFPPGHSCFHPSNRTQSPSGRISAVSGQNEAAKSAPAEAGAPAELESHVNEAIAICGGDVRAALRAALIANTFLEAEMERLAGAVSFGFTRGSPARRASGNT